MNIIDWILKFLFSAWLFGSAFISAYWFFRPDEWFWKEHKYITGVIAVGAFLVCWWVVMFGSEPFLRFIPEGWVYETEEGEIRIVRLSITGWIGLAASIFLALLFGKVRELRNNNEELRTELRVSIEVSRRKELYKLFDDILLKSKATEYKLKLEEFAEIELQRKLTYDEEFERQVLLVLLDEWENKDRDYLNE